MNRSGLRGALMMAGLGLSAGCAVGVANWLSNFSESDYARAFLLLLLLFWAAHGLAAGLGVAAGLAVLRRLGVAGRRRPDAATRWPRLRVAARRAWAVTVGLGLALLAAYVGSAPHFSGLLTTEPRDMEAEAAGPPNVIMISLDTTRPDHLGAYGYPGPTSPSFDALSREGVLFTRARATSSWTIPSHASLFTGVAPSHLGPGLGPRQKRGWAKMPPSATTMAEILLASGYHTAGFVAAPTLQSFFGFAQGFEIYNDRRPVAFSAKSDHIFGARQVRRILNTPPEKFLRFMDPAFREVANYLYDEGHGATSETHIKMSGVNVRWSSHAHEINHRIFRWLDRRPPRPYFLFVNYFDPHDPYEPHDPDPGVLPPGIDPEVGFISQNGTLESVLRHHQRPDGDRLEQMRALYDAELSVMDRGLGRLLQRLEAENDLHNALVVVVSDHGEAFGEHDLIFHGHHLYDPSLRQVLFVAGPGLPAGRRVDEPVSGVDVLPTVLDLAGIQVQGEIRGRSLRPLMEGGERGVMPIFSEVFGGSESFPDWKAFSDGRISVVAEGMKLIRDMDGGELLFDLEDDPGEERDLAAERPEDVARLGLLLDAYTVTMAQTGEDGGEEPSHDLLETLRGLGYIE